MSLIEPLKHVPETPAPVANRPVGSPFISFAQLAEEYFNVTESVLKRRIRRHGKGILPPVIQTPGCREWHFERSDVLAWFRAHKRDYREDARASRDAAYMKRRKSHFGGPDKNR